MTASKDRRSNQYAEADKLAALELAATVGVLPASKHLNVSRQSIYRWMAEYPKLWSDLRANDPNAGRRGLAMRLEDLADRYRAAEHDLLDRVEDELIAKADPKEAAALMKAMGSSRQAAVAGVRSISGEPETHEHNINFPALEAAMERLLEGAQPPEPPAIEAEAVLENG
jgi:hypothetical protein